MSPNLFSKAPRLVTFLTLHVAILSAVVIKFATKSIYGIGILALGLYVYRVKYASIPPMTLSELVIFFDAMSETMKAAVVASILTVVGFLIVLHSASISWKGEWKARYNADIAENLDGFFHDVLRLISGMAINLRTILKARDVILAQGVTQESNFYALEGMKAVQSYVQQRTRLSDMRIESCRFPGQYYLALSTLPNAPKLLQDAIDELANVAESIWLTTPYFPAIEEQYSLYFASQIKDTAPYLKTIDKFDNANYGISMPIGTLKGLLLGKLVGFTMWSYLNGAAKNSLLQQAMQTIEDRNKGLSK